MQGIAAIRLAPSGRCCSTALAAISIGGSIGGINSATNTILNQQARHEREIARFDEQIASIERQIQLNEEAARISRWRVSPAASAACSRPTLLRPRQTSCARAGRQALGEQSHAGVDEQPGGRGGMSTARCSSCWSASSALLDAFGAYFVSPIGEENCFRRSWQWQREREVQPAPAPAVASRPEPEPAVVAQVRSAPGARRARRSKRGGGGIVTVAGGGDRVFQHLLAQGTGAGQQPPLPS